MLIYFYFPEEPAHSIEYSKTLTIRMWLVFVYWNEMKVSSVFVLWKNNRILKKSIQNKHERLKHEDLGPEKSSKFSKPENLLYIICQSRTTLTSVPGNSSRQWIIHFSSSHIKATEIITSLGVKRHEFINSLKRCLIQNYAKLHVSLVENSNGNYARGHASKAAIFFGSIISISLYSIHIVLN